MQISLVIIAPTSLMGRNTSFIALSVVGNRGIIRINPYLPSFSSSPAKIIDPATGASTWAFGSHRCTKYRGIFTINAPTKTSIISSGIFFIMCGATVINLNILCLFVFIVVEIIISSGRLAVIVYIMR